MISLLKGLYVPILALNTAGVPVGNAFSYWFWSISLGPMKFSWKGIRMWGRLLCIFVARVFAKFSLYLKISRMWFFCLSTPCMSSLLLFVSTSSWCQHLNGHTFCIAIPLLLLLVLAPELSNRFSCLAWLRLEMKEI